MKRMTKEDKLIEAECNRCYKVHGNCVQIPIFDLSKIFDAGRAAGKAGQSIEEAIKTAIAKYRKN